MKSFYENLNQFNNRIAIITEKGEKFSYGKLIEDGDILLNSIEQRKVIFLICNNCVEAVCAYLACLRKKVVPVLINAGITSDLYEKLLRKYKPAYIFLPSNCIKNNNEYEEVSKYINYTLLKTNFDIDYMLNDELALLLTTSGSTGSPKLVRQSYKNINSNAGAIAEYLDIKKDDRAITTMPMNYTYGLSIINSHLFCGASIIINDFTLMNKEFWELLKTEKATTFGGVPYIYEMLKKLRFSRMDLPSLKYITQAGGKLSKDLVAEFSKICADKGIKMIIMYGQTEATARMAYLPWEYIEAKSGSMGIAIPGGELLLVDDNNNVIKENNVTGELVYKGDNVTLGYAENCYDLARNDDNKGVLYTGDMATRDKDGFYYIVGRKKRFLKIFGNRVNLDEVEGILKSNGYECVCAGVDDKLKIYVTNMEQEKTILSFICKKIGLNQSGFSVTYIKEIPRNEAGKVLYSALN